MVLALSVWVELHFIRLYMWWISYNDFILVSAKVAAAVVFCVVHQSGNNVYLFSLQEQCR